MKRGTSMANSPPEFTNDLQSPADVDVQAFTPRPKRTRLTPSQRYFRRMKKRRWMLPLWIWLFTALPEVLLHAASSPQGAFWNSGAILGPLFALVPALCLYVLINSIPKPKLNYAIIILYSIVLYFLYASQLVYYKVFGTFYSVYSMTNGTSALQFVNTIINTIRGNLPTMFLMAVPMLILLVLGWRLFNFEPIRSWKLKGGLLVLAVLAQLGLVQSLPLFGGTGDTTAYGLYHNASDSYTSVNKLGLMTAFRLDVKRTITGENADGSIIVADPPETTEASVSTDPPETTVPDETASTETTGPVVDTSPNVMDINFEGLIAESTNESVMQVHQYFASRTPSAKNEKTGLFEGSNLIMITAEAFSYLVVDPDRTPTLYKLMTEGYSFTNYYVPDWGVSTTDGEYAFLTGTIPKDGVWSFKRSSGNAMPLTMSQQLLRRGYSAYAYHGHTYTYYGRDQYLTNLGFQYKGYGNGLDVTWQWPESDVEVVDLSTADYVSSSPFVTYYMTISGHREFNFQGNSIAAKNKELVAEEPYSEAVQAYLACQMELENALTLLLQRLEEAGVLENTVIVLTADHYPNGLTAEQIGELLGHTPERNFEIYQNGCIIYKPGMEPEVIDTPCSHLDLLPTLSNLFGLEFDSRLYMGRDIFSDAEPLVCFRNRSWITDKAMYNAATGEVTCLTDSPVTDEYITAIQTEVNNRFTVSSRILEYDYWNILFGE